MFRVATAILLSCLVIMTIAQGLGEYNRRQCTGKEKEDCDICRKFPRKVSIRIRNTLRPPFFEELVTLNCTRYETLFYIMQQAAEVNAKFKFQVTYFRSLGFSVDAINNVAGTDSVNRTSFWEILDGNLNQTSVGMSTYKPFPGETVTFNLTVGGHH